MSRKSIVITVLVALLLAPTVALAHGGHVHKVMGTVAAISPTRLEVKTADGKTVVVTLNTKTVYQQDKTKVDVGKLKAGDRVVVEGTQADGAKTVTAQTVRIGTAAAAK